MDSENLKKQFERMGARLSVGTLRPRARRSGPAPSFLLDVKRDHRGEHFELLVRQGDSPDIFVGQVDEADRHLLLLFREEDASRPGAEPRVRRMLCGHDERHWFIARVPGPAPTVARAKQALKPEEVRVAEVAKGVKTKHRHRRRNEAFLRQGEWFFLPAPNLAVDPRLILRDEPLLRGGGRPHRAELLFRRGGVRVHVCRAYPTGLTDDQYEMLLRRDPEKRRLPWREMVRRPEVYAKGRIRHPDHATVVLRGWYRVLPNTESRAPGGGNLAFLD